MVIKLTMINVLTPFLSKPYESLHLADISREVGQPHPTVRQHLNDLESKGVLVKTHKGRLTLYSLNHKNTNLIDYLVIAEKSQIIKKCSEYPVLSEFIASIRDVKAIIFGSSAESFKSANDIDLLVIGQIDSAKIRNISKRLGKSIHLINVTSFEEISESLRQEILKKHLIVNSTEEFLRWLLNYDGALVKRKD